MVLHPGYRVLDMEYISVHVQPLCRATSSPRLTEGDIHAAFDRLHHALLYNRAGRDQKYEGLRGAYAA